MTEFHTPVFKIPASVYLKAEARDFAFRRGWLAALPLVAAFIAGLFDVRFLLVGLMLLFIVVPHMMALIYFHRLLSPEARDAMATKAVSGTQGKELRIVFYDCDPAGDKPPVAIREEAVSWRDIISARKAGRYRIIRIRGRELPLIIEAAGDGEPRADFFARIQ